MVQHQLLQLQSRIGQGETAHVGAAGLQLHQRGVKRQRHRQPAVVADLKTRNTQRRGNDGRERELTHSAPTKAKEVAVWPSRRCTHIESTECRVGQRHLIGVGEVAAGESGAVQVQRRQTAEFPQSDGALEAARHGQVQRLRHHRLEIGAGKHEGTSQIVVAQIVLTKKRQTAK